MANTNLTTLAELKTVGVKFFGKSERDLWWMVEHCRQIAKDGDYNTIPATMFSSEKNRQAVIQFCQRWDELADKVACSGCGAVVSVSNAAQTHDNPMRRRPQVSKYYCDNCARDLTPHPMTW